MHRTTRAHRSSGERSSLPQCCVEHILSHCDGVPLHIEQMVHAFLDSNLLFIDDHGDYELEGSLDSLRLPTNVSQSIRLRIEAVRLRDPSLDHLLQLTAVMGGSFTLEAVTCAWLAIGGEAAQLNAAVQAGVEQRLLKYMTSSGQAAGQGAQRRRSSVGSAAAGRFTFHHLRIQENVRQLLPPEQARRMHTACAQCLHGLADSSQLILHHESAGNYAVAASLLCNYTERLRAMGLPMTVQAASCRRCLECVRQAEQPMEAVELRVILMLMSCWLLTPAETAEAHARFRHLTLQPSCKGVVKPTELLMATVTHMMSNALSWSWWDADSALSPSRDTDAKRELLNSDFRQLTTLAQQEFAQAAGGPAPTASFLMAKGFSLLWGINLLDEADADAAAYETLLGKGETAA